MGLVRFRKLIEKASAKDVVEAREVTIAPATLRGTLRVPADAKALVIFAHGSGSSRFSPRNRVVAQALNQRAIATLLCDLLTEEEAEDRQNAFDIDLLTNRLVEVAAWIDGEPQVRHFAVGFFGAGTGSAAALMVASRLGGRISAVVSRGGRPDLVSDVLGTIHTPSLMIVGSEDAEVIALNEQALARLQGPKAIEIVPGAGHLFREPGALTAVTLHAARWFEAHLMRGGAAAVESPEAVAAG